MDFLREYDELQLIELLSKVVIGKGLIVAILLMFRASEYGRHLTPNSTRKYGIGVKANLAWFLQELPAFVVPCVILWYAPKEFFGVNPNVVLLVLFVVHYFHRALIYPWLIKGGKPTPVFILSWAFIFCCMNGYMQARYLTKFVRYDASWFTNPCFVGGIVMFLSGMAINIHSDHILCNLRKPGETGYKIPRGGMFDYVSGANFFGEIIEWSGFALACWSLPSLSFACFTVCNIGARALQHHRWYHNKFEDYPKSRKALIPFIL